MSADYYRVEVFDNCGQIVAIEPNMLSGREIGPSEERCIRAAIQNLCSFIGLSPAAREGCDSGSVSLLNDGEIKDTLHDLPSEDLP